VFRLDAAAGAGGGSVRDHLEQVARQTGKVPAPLENVPELWPAAEHLWSHFLDLIRGRSTATPLSYGEIAAWARLIGLHLVEWEVHALRRLDLAWLSSVAEPKDGKAHRRRPGSGVI